VGSVDLESRLATRAAWAGNAAAPITEF